MMTLKAVKSAILIFELVQIFLRPVLAADQTADVVVKSIVFIDAPCTRSVVAFAKVLRLKCLVSEVYVLWPDEWSSIIFITQDQQGNQYQIAFNSEKLHQTGSGLSVMPLASVEFGKLSVPEQRQLLTVKGNCKFLSRDGQKMMEYIICEAHALSGRGSFQFETGPGPMRYLKLNESDGSGKP